MQTIDKKKMRFIKAEKEGVIIMKRFMDQKIRLLFSLILGIFLFTGCGGGGGGTGHWLAGNEDIIAPTVTSVVPLNNDTDVAINTKVSATFSESMDPATIIATTFTLKQGTTTVAGTVAYYGLTAVFTPTSNLTVSTLYTATITTGAKDLVANAMADNKVWTFTTGVAADTTAPMVTLTVPATAATGVLTNAKNIATFSEAMDPATITTTTFTLKQGTTAVSGSVTYSGVTAVFTPASNLTASTLYTATITTGAKDLAGNAMAANKVWTFTTGATADTTSPSVTSIVPVINAIDVALNTSVSAIFSETMDPVTITTTTFTLMKGTTAVSGSVTYSGVTAIFMPDGNLTGSTLYTATITTGAMDLGGNALAVNKVWTFTTGATPDTTRPAITSVVPANNATGIALNSSITAVFSETMDPVTIDTTTFTLMKGTTAVSGIVTYSGVTAVFTPDSNLTASTLYTATITTGARDLAKERELDRNQLGGNQGVLPAASSYVWTFTTGAAADTTRPTVTSVVPLSNATGISLNSSVTAIFSEAMNPAVTSTFTLKQGTTVISGSVDYSGVTAVFTPDSNLTASTLYTATISTGAMDLSGNTLAAAKVWTFTTGAAADTTSPTVTSVVPLSNATGIALNSSVTAIFSEAMNPAVTSTFSLKQGTTVIPGSVNYSGVTAIFTPDSNLTASTIYTATISTAAKDLAGNTLAAAKVWTFTTGAAADTTSPTVSSVVPLSNATGIALNTSVTAIFSEAMNPAVTSTFTLKQGTTVIPGSVGYTGVTAIFTPDSNLTASTLYTATISTAAMDLAGNTLAVAKVWTFTTGAAADTTSPTVSSVLPLSNATGVVLNTSVSAVFSEAMNPAVTSTFTLKQGTNVISGSVGYSGVTAVFTPDSDLTASTLYTATISTAAMDLAGNNLAVAKVWTFTTGAPPVQSAWAPAKAATIATSTPTITFTTDENADCKWSLTDQAYGNMAGDCTGDGTMSQSCVTSGLSEGSEIVYIACRDTTLIADTIASNEDVNYTVDTTLPVQSAWNPAKAATITTTTPTISLTTTENADCKWSLTDQAYGNMAGDCTGDGTTSQSCVTSGLSEGAEIVYIACRDTALNADSIASNVHVNYTVDTILPMQSAWNPAKGAAIATSTPTIVFTTDENADCKWSLTDQAYGNMVGNCTGDGTTSQSCITSGLLDGPEIVYIACRDTALNADTILSNQHVNYTVDSTLPTVTLVVIEDGSTGVCINQTFTATFSEEMASGTVRLAGNFTVQTSGPPLGIKLAGLTTYDEVTKIATFKPTAPLTASVSYTATIKGGASGVTDLVGNPLALDKVWTFTTGTNECSGAVDLGDSSNFAVLASAAITNIPTSIITGDIGLTPDTGSNISGFSVPAICPEVTGTVYAVDAAGPACATIDAAFLLSAKADAALAFTDARAAVRGTPVAMSGNINGLTLYPGLYESGTSIEISPGGIVYLDAQGDGNAIFIIRSATTITTSATSQVVLTKGAKANNVYWTAGSAITLGTNSFMKGTLIAGTGISLLTGANLEGRALNQGAAAAAITLDSNTITVPSP